MCIPYRRFASSHHSALDYQLEKCVFLHTHYMIQVLKLSFLYPVNNMPHSMLAPHFEGMQLVLVVFLEVPCFNFIKKRGINVTTQEPHPKCHVNITTRTKFFIFINMDLAISVLTLISHPLFYPSSQILNRSVWKTVSSASLILLITSPFITIPTQSSSRVFLKTTSLQRLNSSGNGLQLCISFLVPILIYQLF